MHYKLIHQLCNQHDFNTDQMTMTSWMNNNFIPSNSVSNNRNNCIGGANDVFDHNFGRTNQCQRQVTPAVGGIGQYYPQNELAIDYACKSSSSIDGSATQSSSPHQPPPRPQRPFTEYNVFFRLERELLLQGESDTSGDLEKRSKAEQKILSSGKEIESSDLAAHRPRQYRHLIMPTDWFIVGSKNKSASTKLSLGVSPPNTMSSEAALVGKQKETRAKFTFLELTKLISSRWREVCKNDPVTKEFCNKIASKEAARYKAELEEYRHKYGAEAAKGKKRKPRKSLLPEPQKKTKQVKEEEEGEICMLNNFVPVEGNLKEEARPSPVSVLEDGTPDIIVKMYARQRELQAQLEQRQRRLASLPLSSSFTVNTFQGIPKDFSQAQTFQGAIITPNPPSADRYAQGRQILQNGYDSPQRLGGMRRSTGQSFVRQNSAFDSKYDFLNSADGVIDDDKVEEYLRDFECKVFQQMFKNSTYEDPSTSGVGMCIDRNLYLTKFHRRCVEKSRSRCSPSEVSQFDLANVTSNATTAAPTLKKLRSLQSNDWALFTKHVEIGR